MTFLLVLLFISCGFLGLYLVLDAVLPIDPDLRDEWTCEIPGCAAHRRPHR